MRLLNSLFLTMMVLCIPMIGNAQYTFDGNYSPCPSSGNDEYANAASSSPNTGSSTCDVQDVYLDIYNDGGVDYFILGVRHGNSGQSNFRVYFNTDCDETTGQILAPENLGDPGTIAVGGADYYVNFTTSNNPSAEVFEWNGSAFVSSVNGAAETGVSCSGSSDFVEARVPVLDVFDPCDNNSCGLLELSTIISNAGGSPNSRYCQGIELSLPIPVNDPPAPDFTFDLVCNPGLPPEPDGFLPLVCLEQAGIIDPNLNIGDEITYEWNYYLNGSSTAGTLGTFINKDNIGGTPITSANLNDINTCFEPDVSEIPGSYTFELILTDSYDCTQETQESTVGVTYTVTVDYVDEATCRTLPIELSSFSGQFVNDKEVELNWTTESEIENEWFDVERKFDFEDDFSVVHTLPGAGTSSEQISYEFTDRNVGYNKVQYRLKQIDFSGEFSYSNIIELEKEVTENRVALYTTGEEFIVEIETVDENYAQKIEVYNVLGQLVEVIDLANSGEQKIMQRYFSTQEYSRGIFLVNIVFEDGKNTVLKSMK